MPEWRGRPRKVDDARSSRFYDPPTPRSASRTDREGFTAHLGAGDWSPDLIPGRLYRRTGVAPDVLAVEMPHECAEARGLCADDDGSDVMLAAMQRAWDAHVRAQAARRVEASRNLPRGQRRLSDHIDRLAEKWGDRLDLSAIGAAGEETVGLYETGERVELRVGGEIRRATVGCTGTARPEFVYLLSLPVLDVEDAAA